MSERFVPYLQAIGRYPDMKINVSAILNDTTGCLLACAYKRPDCALGVIIGTGTNARQGRKADGASFYKLRTGVGISAPDG